MHCATCKHWKRVADDTFVAGTGIVLWDEEENEEGEQPSTEHGRCARIGHTHDATKRDRRPAHELRTEQAVARDVEDYSAWLCTLPTFGCTLHEPKEENDPGVTPEKAEKHGT